MDWDDESLFPADAAPGRPERTARCRHRPADPPEEPGGVPYWATGDADEMLVDGEGTAMGDQGVAMMGKVAMIIAAVAVVLLMIKAH